MTDERRAPWVLIATFIVTFAVFAALGRLISDLLGIPHLSLFAPALAALVTWLTARVALPLYLPAAVNARQFKAHTFLGVGAGVVFTIVLLAIAFVWQGEPEPFAMLGLPFELALELALGLVSVVSLELGLRGLLQPLLETRMPRWTAGIVVGVVWGVLFAPLGDDPLLALGFVVTCIALSALLGYLGNGSWQQRVISTMVAHAIIVSGTYVVISPYFIDPRATFAPAIAATITTAVFLTMFVVATRRRKARAAAAVAG